MELNNFIEKFSHNSKKSVQYKLVKEIRSPPPTVVDLDLAWAQTSELKIAKTIKNKVQIEMITVDFFQSSDMVRKW